MTSRKSDIIAVGSVEWSFLDRLSFLIRLAQYPIEQKAEVVAEEGLTFEQVEEWRLEAIKRLPGLPPPKRKSHEKKRR